MSRIPPTLDNLVAPVTKSRWVTEQILEHVVRLELYDRARRGMERRLGRGRLGRFKAMNFRSLFIARLELESSACGGAEHSC